jgi:protein TonB
MIIMCIIMKISIEKTYAFMGALLVHGFIILSFISWPKVPASPTLLPQPIKMITTPNIQKTSLTMATSSLKSRDQATKSVDKAPPLITNNPSGKKVTSKPVKEKSSTPKQKISQKHPSSKTTNNQSATPTDQSPTSIDANVATVTTSEPTIQAPVYHAAYLRNPKPHYPPLSKEMRETGVVRLNVQVSADGRATRVMIAQSSGHERLDLAALKAVKQWQFTPAKRGSEAIAASLIVPIEFSLKD